MFVLYYTSTARFQGRFKRRDRSGQREKRKEPEGEPADEPEGERNKDKDTRLKTRDTEEYMCPTMVYLQDYLENHVKKKGDIVMPET